MKAVKYKVNERMFRNNRGELRIGYVTQLKADEKLTSGDVLEILHKRTGIHEPKIEFILMNLQEVLLQGFYQGRPVEVPHIGTFRLGLRSEAKVRKQDAGKKAMMRLIVNFMPHMQIKKRTELNNIKFQEVEK